MFFSRNNRKAGFLIIGGQKCGSSSLYNYFAQHEGCLPAIKKEVTFFNSESYYQKGIDYYHKFINFEKNKISFEVSPGYLMYEKAPERIYDYNKKIKLIAVLRNPSDRAFSAWNMYRDYYEKNPQWFKNWMINRDPEKYQKMVRRDLTKVSSFNLFLKEELCSISKGEIIDSPILSHGCYSDHIKRYYKYFDESQILLIDYDTMKENLIGALKQIEEFIGLKKTNWSDKNLEKVRIGNYISKLNIADRTLLDEYYREEKQQLIKLTGIGINWL